MIYYVWPVLRERNIEYENNSIVIEQHLVENLNNVDKIVSRGQIEHETIYLIRKTRPRFIHRNYYYSVSTTKFALKSLHIVTMFVCVWIFNPVIFARKIDLFSLLLIYIVDGVQRTHERKC